MDASQLATLCSEPGHYAAYKWRNIMIVAWSKAGTGPAIEQVAQARLDLQAEHPDGVSVVYLIGQAAGLASEQARAGAKTMMERFKEHRACLAVVIQADGFAASAQRAAAMNVRMQVAAAFPMLVCTSAAEVADWLPGHHEKRTGTKVSPQKLRQVLDGLLARL